MANYIERAVLNIPPGVLTGTIEFQPGLNLISGENGTFKTKLLQAIGTGSGVTYHETESGPRLQAISPKRNAQRQTVETIYNSLRRQDVKLSSLLTVKNMNDNTFETYPSIGELFLTVYDDLSRDGGNRIEKMNEVAADFNQVVQSIFDDYELHAIWDDELGAPKITLLKQGTITVPLEGLSTGEQEILSLVAYVHSSRDSFDIFLIDEPEVHLNWHLEEKLFDFLDTYCETYQKQLIVVTHSRVVFTQKFLPKTTFLFWHDGEVKWGHELSSDQRRRLAGGAIEILRLGTFSRPTFFVEDSMQVQVVEAVADLLDAEVFASACGNKANVRSLYRMAVQEDWPESYYFVEDGDNEGPHVESSRFIHLDKYCMESYLLNPAILSGLSEKDESQVNQAIFEAVQQNRDKILNRNQFLAFLFDGLTVGDLTEDRLSKLDASQILETVLAKLGIRSNDFVRRYVEACERSGVLKEVLPTKLVESIEQAIAAQAST